MKAIILAAGFSSRMGTLKQVMEIDGQPMVQQVATPFLAAGLELIVVIGHERTRVQDALRDLPCSYVINPHPEEGMFSSVRLGCLSVPSGEACLLTTCDCPGVRTATIHQIINTRNANPNHVIIPSYDRRRGHPVALPAFLVDQIRGLPPSTPGLNSLWRAQPELVRHMNVDDPAVLRDLDRPEDLAGIHK